MYKVTLSNKEQSKNISFVQINACSLFQPKISKFKKACADQLKNIFLLFKEMHILIAIIYMLILLPNINGNEKNT